MVHLTQMKLKVKLKKPVLPKRKERDSFARSRMRHLITVWGFLVLTLISGTVTLNALVGNSQHAKKLYDQLLATDQAGGNVEQSLYNLRSFMYGHMNTTIGSPTGVQPPIQLKGTYDRLVAAETARVAAAKDANSSLYNTAQHVCEAQIPDGLSGRGRVPCITEYVTTHSQSETTNPIQESLYKFDFVSPMWSADTAGIGILVTSVLFLVFLYRFLTYRRALHHLKMSS